MLEQESPASLWYSLTGNLFKGSIGLILEILGIPASVWTINTLVIIASFPSILGLFLVIGLLVFYYTLHIAAELRREVGNSRSSFWFFYYKNAKKIITQPLTRKNLLRLSVLGLYSLLIVSFHPVLLMTIIIVHVGWDIKAMTKKTTIANKREALINHIRTYYQIKVRQTKKLKGGKIAVFKPIEIKTILGKKSVFKDLSDDIDKAKYFVAFQQRLRDQGIKIVPKIISHKEQGFITYYQGRYVALEKFIKGMQINWANATAKHFFNMGKLAARIRKATEGWDIKKYHTFKSRSKIAGDIKRDFEKLYEELTAKTELSGMEKMFLEKWHFIQAQLELFTANFLPIENQLPVSHIHNDIFGNCKVNKKGKIIGLIDFNFAMKDISILEFNNIVQGMRKLENEIIFSFENFSEVYKGYTQSYKLLDIEKKAILEVIRLRFLEDLWTIYCREKGKKLFLKNPSLTHQKAKEEFQALEQLNKETPRIKQLFASDFYQATKKNESKNTVGALGFMRHLKLNSLFKVGFYEGSVLGGMLVLVLLYAFAYMPYFLGISFVGLIWAHKYFGILERDEYNKYVSKAVDWWQATSAAFTAFGTSFLVPALIYPFIYYGIGNPVLIGLLGIGAVFASGLFHGGVNWRLEKGQAYYEQSYLRDKLYKYNEKTLMFGIGETAVKDISIKYGKGFKFEEEEVKGKIVYKLTLPHIYKFTENISVSSIPFYLQVYLHILYQSFEKKLEKCRQAKLIEYGYSWQEILQQHKAESYITKSSQPVKDARTSPKDKFIELVNTILSTTNQEDKEKLLDKLSKILKPELQKLLQIFGRKSSNKPIGKNTREKKFERRLKLLRQRLSIRGMGA